MTLVSDYKLILTQLPEFENTAILISQVGKLRLGITMSIARILREIEWQSQECGKYALKPCSCCANFSPDLLSSLLQRNCAKIEWPNL